LYDSGNGTINAEVTGRTTQIEVNADGDRGPIHFLVLHEKYEEC
jgi:hypothetical protein